MQTHACNADSVCLHTHVHTYIGTYTYKYVCEKFTLAANKAQLLAS